MLQFPFMVYPAIGAAAGLATAGGKKIFTGKADTARCVLSITILETAQAAFVLIAAAYGLIPASIFLGASIGLGGSIFNKSIVRASDTFEIALALVCGSVVGAAFGYYGFVAVSPGTI